MVDGSHQDDPEVSWTANWGAADSFDIELLISIKLLQNDVY